MRASALEFRLRVAIVATLITLGFWSPWLGAGARISLLEWLGLQTSRAGVATFTAAAPMVVVLACVLAALGVWLRVWGTACLSPQVVHDGRMQGAALVAAGPYRYVRNPLYLGNLLTIAATAFAMPPTGALFAVVLSALFLFRLILGEEAFLERQLGEPYRAYRAQTPRLFPRLRTTLADPHSSRHWGRAVVTELYSVGVLVTFATLSWRYDHWLLIKGILISFGVSLVAQALLPPQAAGQGGVTLAP